MFYQEARIFNNVHPEIVAPYPKNNNLNISALSLIIAKFLIMFCSRVTPSSSLDVSFLLVGIYALETFLDNTSTFLNLSFLARLKEMPSEIIRSALKIVRRVQLEVIIF